MRTAAALACGAAGAGCAAIGESPRAAYAVPPQVSSPAAVSVENDAKPSFSIAASTVDMRSSSPVDVGVAPLALEDGRLGLFPVERFELATGECGDCDVPAAALWWFQDELIAVRRSPGVAPTISVDAQPVDGTGVSRRGFYEAVPPAIVWLGAPQRVSGARLTADAREVQIGERSIALELTQPIATNAAYADSSTARFFAGRPLAIRGTAPRGTGAPTFIARTVFPEDQNIGLAALHAAPLGANELLGTLIEAQTNERYRLLFSRSDPAGWGGLPVLAFVLTGAQGDDDGSRAGHLAVATGVLGERGEWDDWLVTNFYPLLEGNAKGIIPASLPIDNYLYDLNSGQLYYRPGYMLIAVLARPRAAIAVQHALQDTMLALHCGRIEFDRARRNSTAMTIDPLRELGWRIPAVGATSRLLGLAAAPVAAIVRRSFKVAGSVRATFAAERTRLLPRVAFEVAGHDLLQIAALGTDGDRELTPFERTLSEDVEGLLFVRLPQVPSSRRFGTYPVASLWAYGAGLLSDPGSYEAAPEAEDREFSESLRGACAGG